MSDRIQNIIKTTYPLIKHNIIGAPLELESSAEKNTALILENLFITSHKNYRPYAHKINDTKTKKFYDDIVTGIQDMTEISLERKSPAVAFLGYLYLRSLESEYCLADHIKKFNPVFYAYEQKIEEFIFLLEPTAENESIQKKFTAAKKITDFYIHEKAGPAYYAALAEKVMGSKAQLSRKSSGLDLSPAPE